MPKDVNQMTPDELREEVLRLREKIRDDALRCAREMEEMRRSFEKKPPEFIKNIHGR